MSSATVDAEPAVIKPSRPFRQFIRRHLLATSVLLTAAAMGLLRGWWRWTVDRRLEAENAKFRAQDEPATWSEIKVPFLPVAENAWTLQRQAIGLVVAPPPSQTVNYYANYYPFGAAWDQSAEASEQGNQPAFQLARQARSRPQTQLVASYGMSAVNFGGYGSNLRELAQMLSDGAAWSHQSGRDVEALDRLLDAYHVANTAIHDHTIVGHLVAIGVYSIAANRTQVIAPGVHASEPAVRDKLRLLIAVLGDESEYLQSLVPTIDSSDSGAAA